MEFQLDFLNQDGLGEDIPFSMVIIANEYYDAWAVGNRLARRLACRFEGCTHLVGPEA